MLVRLRRQSLSLKVNGPSRDGRKEGIFSRAKSVEGAHNQHLSLNSVGQHTGTSDLEMVVILFFAS